MEFHQISIGSTCFHITERNLMVTHFILRKMDEIKYTDVDTFLQILVRLSLFQLTSIHFPDVKEDTVCPVREIQHLHLQVKLRSICQKHHHIKNPQLIIPIFLSCGSGEKRCLPDLPGVFSENSSDEALPHFAVLHQFFETEVHSGKHDKVVICCCHKILLSFISCVLHSLRYPSGIASGKSCTRGKGVEFLSLL